jgi:cytoskeletal protein CcmA (bactofilin family)
MKKTSFVSLLIGIVLVSVLTFVGVANAQGFKAGDNIGVAAGETVDSALFAAGNNVNIAGTVNGDVYCAGQTINISGTVNGDVICAGQSITISGKVDGSVRVAGQTVTLSGAIAGSATVGGQNMYIGSSAVIGRDLLGGGQAVTLDGKVARDVTTGAQNLTVNGTVGRDINGQVESLDIGTTGKVAGNVMYTSKNELSVATGGQVAGTVTRTEPKAYEKYQMSPEAMVAFAVGSAIFVFIATVVFALVLALMFPKILEDSAVATVKSPGMTVLTGFVAMVIAPVAITMLFITVVGLPVALFTMFAWFIVLLLSVSFSGYLLGKLIISKSTKNPLLVMLTGISIIAVAMLIPVINFIVVVVAGMFGTGAILMQSKKLFERPALKKAK